MLRAHALDRFARANEAAEDIDREHALQARDADFIDARLHIDDTGVVDQARQRAELGVDAREHRQHRGFVGNVGGNDDRAPAERTDLRGHGLGRVQIARAVDGHVPALPGAGDGRGSADAAAGAGDEDAARSVGNGMRVVHFFFRSRSNLRQYWNSSSWISMSTSTTRSWMRA